MPLPLCGETGDSLRTDRVFLVWFLLPWQPPVSPRCGADARTAGGTGWLYDCWWRWWLTHCWYGGNRRVSRSRWCCCACAINKCDLLDNTTDGKIFVSAKNNTNIELLKDRIAKVVNAQKSDKRLCGDLVNKNDFVVLVIPIDSAAPKGRIILPQQQAIRDLLDSGAIPVCVRESELADTLKNLGTKPKLVITDSQVFKPVSEIVPNDIKLTSFSILMARYKGFLKTAVNGARAIESLNDGDKILISEGCTHHRQCDDIGTVKLPRLLKNYTGKNFEILTSSGKGFPNNLSEFSLAIHCGACMLNSREIISRMNRSVESGVPFTNYGIAIAYMRGILDRSIEMFDE